MIKTSVFEFGKKECFKVATREQCAVPPNTMRSSRDLKVQKFLNRRSACVFAVRRDLRKNRLIFCSFLSFNKAGDKLRANRDASINYYRRTKCINFTTLAQPTVIVYTVFSPDIAIDILLVQIINKTLHTSTHYHLYLKHR